MASQLSNLKPYTMTHLNEGQKAPDFAGINQEGNQIKLSDFLGKKIVLYFYPKDDTPGCTAESCNLRDNYDELIKQGFEVIGVSPDSEKSHVKFGDKYNLSPTFKANNRGVKVPEWTSFT